MTCQEETAGCDVTAATVIDGPSRPTAPAHGTSPVQATSLQQFYQHLAACKASYGSPAADMAHPPGHGDWYLAPCVGVLGIPDPSGSPLVWVPDNTPGVSIRGLALTAEQRLKLPPPTMDSSPGPGASTPKIVNLATWAWVGNWLPVFASATVPGVSATATATPYAATWSWGDGATTVCRGPGTPYVDGESDSAAPSPDCGHTYVVDSGREPDLRFPVRAEVRWRIVWSSSTGESGAFPDLTSSATEAWPVEQVEGVNVR